MKNERDRIFYVLVFIAIMAAVVGVQLVKIADRMMP